MAFEVIKVGQYFVENEDDLRDAAQHFFEEQSSEPDADEIEVAIYNHDYPESQNAEYPRIIGFILSPEEDFEVELVYNFGLLDTIDLTANFTQRGYS